MSTNKKVARKAKKEKKLNYEGLKAIISLNWISYVIVFFSLLSLFGVLSSATIGYSDLKDAGNKYVEYVSNKDNYESINKFSFMTHKEVIELAKDAESQKTFMVDFVGISISTFIVVLMLLVLFVCVIFITHCIIKNQEKPFLPSTVKTLDWTIGIIGVLFSLYLIVDFVVYVSGDLAYIYSFETLISIVIAELILYAVRYVFNISAKLQAKK